MKGIFTSLAFCMCVFVASAQNMNLRINEVIADNNNGQMDDFFQYEDWIEIYNPAGSPITNLAGYYITDDPDSLDKWQIPNTNAGVTTILPNGFLCFFIDDDAGQGEDHTGNNFTLSADGETILLVAPDAITIIDSITYPLMAPDVSYGRTCDGCPDWQYFNNVTFEDNNAENQNTDLLFVNEVQAQQTSYYDDLQGEFDPWIEIYNPNNYQVNLANYTIQVSGNPDWVVPNNNPYRTVIPANGFLLIWCDSDTQDDTNHGPITLNTTSGIISIKGPNQTIVETYNYTGAPSNQSYGRQNDGSPTSIVFTQPTPTVTNALVFVAPPTLYINEILPANQTGILDNMDELEDWFEIYNPGSTDVNIGGYYFSDDPEVPAKWIVPVNFPDSVTVPAGGWLLFYADGDPEQGVIHADFRLSNNGEYLGMFSPDGFSVVDEHQWGYLPPDISTGRLTDGAASWVNFSELTPEASNNGSTIDVKDISTDRWVVYPNPASERITFDAIYTVSVYDMNGKQVISNHKSTWLDVSQLPAGLYVIQNKEGATKRLMIQR